MDKSKNKFKFFLDNFIVYGLGGVISKAIPIVMLPIITSLMPNTTYYGLSDLVSAIVSFAGAFAILGMYDGMYRMFFEKDEIDFKKRVCSTTMIFTLISTFIVCLALFVCRNFLAEKILQSRDYINLIYIAIASTLVSATNCIISAPTRMQNKRKVFLITNFISSFLSYSFAIPLVLKHYYVIALPVAALISAITLELAFYLINRAWFSFSLFDIRILKDTLKISLPLFPNFLIYWVFNSCDRVMISSYMTVADVGVYSVGSKLGNVSQLIYTAFAGGWLYFSFSIMKEKDQIETNSKIFEYMAIVSFISTALICVINFPFFCLLFNGDYVLGYTIAPYLFLAPLLQMLFQIASNQLLIIKKTWPNVFLLSVGAISNVILNMVLIPSIGIEGASIATLIGYITTVLITVVILHRMKLLNYSLRLILLTLVFCFYLIAWRFFFRENFIIGGLFFVLYLCIVCFYYRYDIKAMISILKNIKKTV